MTSSGYDKVPNYLLKGAEHMKFSLMTTLGWISAAALTTSPITSYASIILPEVEKTKYKDEIALRLNELDYFIRWTEFELSDIPRETWLTDEFTAEYTTMRRNIEAYCSLDMELNTPFQGQTFESWNDKSLEMLQRSLYCFKSMTTFSDSMNWFSETKKENDITDHLFYRLLNLLYELPKTQGHPLLLSFAQDLRDEYITYKEPMTYYYLTRLSEVNVDSELDGILNTYVDQMDFSDLLPPGFEYEPDDTVIESPPITSTPDTDKTENDAWDEMFDNIWEDAFNEGTTSTPQVPTVSTDEMASEIKRTTTETTISVIDGTCKKIQRVYEEDTLISEKELSLSSREKERCGRTEDIDWSTSQAAISEETFRSGTDVIYYRMGDGDWLRTNVRNQAEGLTFENWNTLLTTITYTHGVGSTQDGDTSLFVLEGKPLLVLPYESTQTLEQLNAFLLDAQLTLQLTDYQSVEAEKEQRQSNATNLDASTPIEAN